MSIKIIGTGHIFQRSVDEVTAAIEQEQPDFVAIELDSERFNALESLNWDLNSGRNELRWNSFLHSPSALFREFLGMIQREMGEKLGIAAGSDMKAAVFAARKTGATLALIDRSISLTMNHLLASPFREKINLLLLSPEIDITRLDNLIEDENLDKVMNELKTKVPGIYGALVGERDQYMAYMLSQIQCQNPEKNIIAIVGAGHKQGINKYLQMLYEIDMQTLMKPKKVYSFQIIPLVFVVIIAYVLMKIWFLSHSIRRLLPF